jgi:probable HAF family extracellular repeat protein
MKHKLCLAIVVICLAAIFQIGTLEAMQYKYQDLTPEALPLGETYYFSAINDSRQIVGYYSVHNPTWGNIYQAFLWDPVKGRILLQSLGYRNSYAYGINNQGQIVGQVTQDIMTTKACLWNDPSIAPTALDDLPGGYYGGWAAAINDNGLIVGAASNSSISRACKWSPPSLQPVNLGTLANNSSASGVNNAGQIVGSSVNGTGASRACIWDAGQLTPQDLATSLPNGSSADKINNQGNVSGGTTKFGYPAGFYWDQLKNVFYFFSSPQFPVSLAGLSDSNQVVGNGMTGPFSWTPNGEQKDLNKLVVNLPKGVTISKVSAISPKKGYIVGTDSQGHVCLLTPVVASSANHLLLLESTDFK